MNDKPILVRSVTQSGPLLNRVIEAVYVLNFRLLLTPTELLDFAVYPRIPNPEDSPPEKQKNRQGIPYSIWQRNNTAQDGQNSVERDRYGWQIAQDTKA